MGKLWCTSNKFKYAFKNILITKKRDILEKECTEKKEIKNANFLKSYLKIRMFTALNKYYSLLIKVSIYFYFFSILVRKKKHEFFVEKENTKYRVVTEELHKSKAADWSFPEIQQNSSRKTNKRLTLSQIQ